jgi:hypothetical protein
VIWRRGKNDLETLSGEIDPSTHEAQINDVIRMTTSLNFDIDAQKFESKMSHLNLVFFDTK